MFKVLIIDDEPIIRQGLKNIINWKEFDCEVCGEAADGLKGLELLKTHMPDIIITDIRMPQIDGLTMISSIKDTVPYTKIIILTGYRNFEYIQEAIKLGAFDFILKPSKFEELTSTISRAVSALKLQKERIEENEKLKEQFEQNIPMLREKLLYDIIYGININKSEINAKMDLFRLKINRFVLVVIESDDEVKEVDQYGKHLYQFGIINIFNDVFSDTFEVTNITLDNKRIAFIVQPLIDTNDYISFIYDKCAYLQNLIQNCFGFTVTTAISSEGSNAFDLSAKLQECQRALHYKFYIGNNSIIPFNDLHSLFNYKTDYSLLIKDYQFSLLESIKTGDKEKVHANLQAILDYVNRLGKMDKDYLKSFYLTLLSSIDSIKSTTLKTDNVNNTGYENIDSLYKIVRECENIKDLNSILKEVVYSVTTEINSFNNKRMRLVLQNAMSYIHKHYSDQVTLKDVAEYTYVSTYYLSRMFKKDLGKNFVDYLNEIRIEKAKELLNSVEYKTYEVAGLVGISNSHYFSKLFKKYVGMTPTEYKDMQKNNSSYNPG